MTVQQAEAILQETKIKVAVQQRFAFDTGTMLRLENYAIINIFDDGRYYIQGENTEALVIAFGLVEEPWDPDTWSGEMPNHAGCGASKDNPRVRPAAPGIFPPADPLKRFEF